MRLKFLPLVLVPAALWLAPHAGAQPPDEVKRLKAEIDLLKQKLSNLEKENELLKREIELMKKEAAAKPDKGDPRNAPRSRTKATVDDIDYELVDCVRKGNRVTFTFSMLCEKEDRLVGGGGVKNYGVFLTAKGGVKVKPTFTEGPGRRLQLKKGIPTSFQLIVTGVDEDIASFDEVVLHQGFEAPQNDAHFYNIPIKK